MALSKETAAALKLLSNKVARFEAQHALGTSTTHVYVFDPSEEVDGLDLFVTQMVGSWAFFAKEAGFAKKDIVPFALTLGSNPKTRSWSTLDLDNGLAALIESGSEEQVVSADIYFYHRQSGVVYHMDEGSILAVKDAKRKHVGIDEFAKQLRALKLKKSPTRKKTAKAVAVTWADLISILELKYDDPRVVELVTGLGRKAPKKESDSIEAKPHGVVIEIGRAKDVDLAGVPPETMLVLEIRLYVNKKETYAGMWVGDLPAWLTYDAKPQSLVGRGKREDDANGETTIVVIEGELEIILVFKPDLREISVLPVAHRAGRTRATFNSIVEAFGLDDLKDGLRQFLKRDPEIAQDSYFWTIVEQRAGAAMVAATRPRAKKPKI